MNLVRHSFLAALVLTGACRSSSQPATFAAAPELRECDGQPLPTYDGADKVRVIVRVKTRTSRSYSPVSLCVRLDDKLLAPEPKTAKIDQLRTGLGFVGYVAPGDHKVKVTINTAGISGSELEGHRFDAEADKDVPGGNNALLDVVLTANGPPEKRLQLKWDDGTTKPDDAPPPP